MRLEYSQFSAEDIEQFGQGAGVVPWALDDHGRVQVLLGRERFMPSWRGSCRWSGFEGSRKLNESLSETAVREFMEESLGVVLSEDEVSSALVGCTLRVVLCIRTERNAQRYHSTYVVRVPWDPTLPQTFRTTRSHLEYLERLLQEWKYLRPHVLGAEDVGPIRCVEGTQHVLRDTLSVPCIVRPPWKLSTDGKYIDALFELESVEDWSLLRDRISRALTDHPALTVRRDAAFGLVQDATLCKDYLEKDHIRWWSLDELRDVMRQRGQRGPDRFRPYFLPVLQLCLDQLEPFECARSSPSRPVEPVAPAPPTAPPVPGACPAGA